MLCKSLSLTFDQLLLAHQGKEVLEEFLATTKSTDKFIQTADEKMSESLKKIDGGRLPREMARFSEC